MNADKGMEKSIMLEKWVENGRQKRWLGATKDMKGTSIEETKYKTTWRQALLH